MKRKFGETVFRENAERGYFPGDEAAHRVAAALGDRFDAPTIAAFADAMAFLQRVGGQFHVVTMREKFADDGRRLTADDPEFEAAEWETAAWVIEYESRDVRLVIAPPPDEVLGLPVTDFEEPPTRVEISSLPELPDDGLEPEPAPVGSGAEPVEEPRDRVREDDEAEDTRKAVALSGG